MSIWSWDGIVPVIDPAAFVHPDATVIGDVIVAAGVYIGPQCVLRGDFGRIEIGAGRQRAGDLRRPQLPEPRRHRRALPATSATAPSCTAAGSAATPWSA